MRHYTRLAAIVAVTMLWTSTAAASGHEHLIPDRRDSLATRAATYTVHGAWLQAPASWTAGGGTRVAALIAVADAGPALALQARGIAAGDTGPWLDMEQTFRGPGHRVAVVDLDRTWPGAEIRIAAADDARAGDIAWELLQPRFPDAGRISRELLAAGPSMLRAVDPILASIGVVSREGWGARPTACTTPEDNWYRMAIHHTAGSQTSGGTVQGALQAVQAYTMDSGGYCDIPYQFLVGYDGSLWEGRSLNLYSGATGGGNNDGNIAVSFLGCYHPSGCPGGVSHQVTDEMMSAAHLLVQTLVRVHDIPSDAEAIRGHRDWPGNATACPGDFVYARLGELRADMAWYAASESDRSFPANDAEPLEIGVGESVPLWIELTNTGGRTWEPGVTFLATTGPRDSESPLYDSSWVSVNRLATVTEPVAPGEVGRFEFSVSADRAGDYTQHLSLVQEQLTWFGDAPWGGGPGDDAVVLHIKAVDGGGGGGPGIDPNGPADDPNGQPGGDNADVTGGCAAAGSGSGAAAVWLLVLLAFAAARRRQGAR